MTLLQIQSGRSDVRFSGGDGRSLEDAVLIEGAHDSEEGVAAEHAYLVALSNLGELGLFPELTTHAMIEHEGRCFDVLELSDEDHETVHVYFDTTEFYRGDAGDEDNVDDVVDFDITEFYDGDAGDEDDVDDLVEWLVQTEIETWENAYRNEFSPELQRRVVFLGAVDLMHRVAIADGELRPAEEREAMRCLARWTDRLQPEISWQKAWSYAHFDPAGNEAMFGRALEGAPVYLLQVLDAEERKSFFSDLVAVAAIDGRLDDEEGKRLLSVARVWGIDFDPNALSQQMRSQAQSRLEQLDGQVRQGLDELRGMFEWRGNAHEDIPNEDLAREINAKAKKVLTLCREARSIPADWSEVPAPPDFFAAEAWDLRGAALTRMGRNREALIAFREAEQRTPLKVDLDQTAHGLPIEVTRKIWYSTTLWGACFGMRYLEAAEVPGDVLELLNKHGEGDVCWLTRSFWQELARRGRERIPDDWDARYDALEGLTWEMAVEMGIIEDV